MEEDRQEKIKNAVRLIEAKKRRETFGKGTMLNNNKKFVGVK